MRRVVGPDLGVKAAGGGVRDDEALEEPGERGSNACGRKRRSQRLSSSRKRKTGPSGATATAAKLILLRSTFALRASADNLRWVCQNRRIVPAGSTRERRLERGTGIEPAQPLGKPEHYHYVNPANGPGLIDRNCDFRAAPDSALKHSEMPYVVGASLPRHSYPWSGNWGQVIQIPRSFFSSSSGANCPARKSSSCFRRALKKYERWTSMPNVSESSKCVIAKPALSFGTKTWLFVTMWRVHTI